MYILGVYIYINKYIISLGKYKYKDVWRYSFHVSLHEHIYIYIYQKLFRLIFSMRISFVFPKLKIVLKI